MSAGSTALDGSQCGSNSSWGGEAFGFRGEIVISLRYAVSFRKSGALSGYGWSYGRMFASSRKSILFQVVLKSLTRRYGGHSCSSGFHLWCRQIQCIPLTRRKDAVKRPKLAADSVERTVSLTPMAQMVTMP